MRALVAVLVVVGCLASVPVVRLSVKPRNDSNVGDLLRAGGYDFQPLYESHGFEVYASADEYGKLMNESSVHVTVLEHAMPLASKLLQAAPPSGYHDPAAIYAVMLQAQTQYPNIARLVDLGAYVGVVPATHEGRQLFALKISDNVGLDEDEPNVMIVSGHHAREIITPEIGLEIIRRLTTGYGTDAVVTPIVDAHEIWIAPTWNPDGLAFVWSTNNLWRKNRRVNTGGSFGVDQNRNYDLNWATTCGGSTTPSSDTYRGPSVASEPETVIMTRLSTRRNFVKVVDYHSFGREVLHSVLCAPLMPAPMASYVSAEATRLANIIGYRTRVPSADGEHQQWQNLAVSTYAFLVETYTEFQPPHAQALAEAARLWPQLVAMFDAPASVHGHVTHRGTGEPLAGVSIQIDNLVWGNYGPVVRRTSTHGGYHLFLANGPYIVTFTLNGFTPFRMPITVSDTPLERSVSLEPV